MQSKSEAPRDPQWLFRKLPDDATFWDKLKADTGLTQAGFFSILELLNPQVLFGLDSSQLNRERKVFHDFDEKHDPAEWAEFTAEVHILLARAKSQLINKAAWMSFYGVILLRQVIDAHDLRIEDHNELLWSLAGSREVFQSDEYWAGLTEQAKQIGLATLLSELEKMLISTQR